MPINPTPLLAGKNNIDNTSYNLYNMSRGYMLKNIYYFVDEKEHNPVKGFIESLPLKKQAKIFAYLIELKNQGHNLRRPMADYVGNEIYELRPKDNRIFYFFFLKDTAVLLHAIKKKTKKIPKNCLDLCIKRKNEVKQHSKTEKLGI